MTDLDPCVLVPCGEDGFPVTADSPPLPEALADMARDLAALYRETGYVPPWTGYLLRRGDAYVGGGAFVGPPRDGRVEMAYFTLPPHEGQGLGRTTAALLVAIARRADPRLVVWAKTLPCENGSTAILRALGFDHVGSTTDHEIGEAWEWVLSPAS